MFLIYLSKVIFVVQVANHARYVSRRQEIQSKILLICFYLKVTFRHLTVKTAVNRETSVSIAVIWADC